MSNLEIAERCASLLEAKDLNGLDDVLAENFRTEGPNAELNKQQAINYLRTLFTAFPDMNFGFRYFEQKQYLVTCDVHQKGTHTGFLDLTPIGLPVLVHPTGKTFDLPVGGFVFGVENGKIIFFSESIREGGGLTGILAQLGVKIP
jgi:hypothetical protein